MKRCIAFTVLLFLITSVLYAQDSGLMLKTGSQGLYLDHKVNPKEGLYAIGRLYNVNPKYIALFNKIDLNAGLAIGQIIQIPLTDTNFNQTSYSGTPIYYTTSSGDNLTKLSNIANKVSVQKLKDWNALSSDNIPAGSRLIVGFLESKEMSALAINNSVKKQATGNGQTAKVNDALPVANEEAPKPGNNNEQPVKKVDAPVSATPANQPVSSVSGQVAGSAPANMDQGYFKSTFEQQIKKAPPRKEATVTSGIFKTNSGWQDGKYYLLIDDVESGTIVRLTNPANGRVVYAKVLGEMKGIRQNEGLDIRISNAAASTLGIMDTEKFIVQVNY